MPLVGNGDTYNIEIKTSGDTKGVKQTQTALDALKGSTDQSHQSFLKLSGAVALGQAAFTVASEAIHKTTEFLGDSFKQYQDAEASSKELAHAVLDVTGASQAQLEATSKLADQLSKKGVLDDDVIRKGQAQLSTFGLTNESVQKLSASMADLTVNQFGVRASGDDAVNAANIMAKALNGNFGALEKMGIHLTDSQKQMIKFGDETQRVDTINQVLAANLRTNQSTALQTTEGKLAHLSVMYGNIKESIGGVIANGLVPLATKLGDAASKIDWQQVINNTVAALKRFWSILVTVYNVVKEAATTIWQFFYPSLKALWDTLEKNLFPALQRIWTMISPVLIPALKILGVIIGGVIIGALWILINILNIAIHAFSDLVQWITNVIQWLKNAVEAVGNFAASVIYWFTTLPNKIKDIWNTVKHDTSQLIDDLVGFFASLPHRAIAAIGNIGKAVGNEIKGALHSIHIPGFASGVSNFSGGLAVVGEQGPELVNLPRGSSVTPNAQTERMLKQTNNNRNVSIGTVVLNNGNASKNFWRDLDNDIMLVGKGVSPRGVW